MQKFCEFTLKIKKVFLSYTALKIEIACVIKKTFFIKNCRYLLPVKNLSMDLPKLAAKSKNYFEVSSVSPEIAI